MTSEKTLELRTLLAMDKVRFETTFGLTVKGSVDGVTITAQDYGHGRKWTKFDTAIFTNEDETLGELMQRLCDLRSKVLAERHA